MGITSQGRSSGRAQEILIIRESERLVDFDAPSSPVVSVGLIQRGHGDVQFGERAARRSNSDYASINIKVRGATDNRTQVTGLGYRVHYVDGALPNGLRMPSAPLIANHGDLFLGWADGRTWEQEPFAFRLYVTAMDLAGNESVPSDTIVVSHDGDMSKLKALQVRSLRLADMQTVSADTPEDAPFVETIRQYVAALTSGHVEDAFNLMSSTSVSVVNGDGTTVDIPARPAWTVYQVEARAWAGRSLDSIERVHLFTAEEGEATEVLGIKNYLVRLKQPTGSGLRFHTFLLARGSDGRVRILQIRPPS